MLGSQTPAPAPTKEPEQAADIDRELAELPKAGPDDLAPLFPMGLIMQEASGERDQPGGHRAHGDGDRAGDGIAPTPGHRAGGPDEAVRGERHVHDDAVTGTDDRGRGTMSTFLVDLDTPPVLVLPEIAGLRIYAGYAGWSPGQLEGEITTGSWFVVPSESGDVFTGEPDELWRRVLRRQPEPLRWVAILYGHLHTPHALFEIESGFQMPRSMLCIMAGTATSRNTYCGRISTVTQVR